MTREERSDDIRARRYCEAADDLCRAIRLHGKRSALGAINRMSLACEEHSAGGDETFDPSDPESLLREAAAEFGWQTDVDGWPT